MFSRIGFYYNRNLEEKGKIPNYFFGWDTEFGFIWKGDTLINNFGLYFSREDTNKSYFGIPNYYIGWVRGVGIIWKGKQYIPEFMRAIGGPPYHNFKNKDN